MKTLTPALNSAVEQIVDSRQEWLQHWESSAIELSCVIAKQIVRRELPQHPEITKEWIAEALQLAGGAAQISIHLHPEDYRTLRTQVEELASLFNSVAPAQVISDEKISQGGCRVETEFGSIDYQIETQLQRIREELS